MKQSTKVTLEEIVILFIWAALLFAFAYVFLGDKLLTTFLLK